MQKIIYEIMKILICHDQKMVRTGLDMLLRQLPDIELIEEASNGNEAITTLQNNDFDIVLLNILLPGISGLEVLELIKKKWKSINVIMLSMQPQEKYAIRALKLGASGYLTNDTSVEELLIAVKKIVAGGKYISNSLAENLLQYLDSKTNVQKHDMLSKREYVTMIKLARGESLKEISNELLISVKTVSTYRTRLMGKMKLRKNTELTKYCLENQLI